MSNPFLFDDEVDPPLAESAPNPFLMSSEPDAAEDGENPFLAEGINPFAFEETEAPAKPIATEAPRVDRAMSFFGTTITEDDDHEPVEPPQNAFTVNEPTDSEKKAGPPPRPTPPNPTTQDLISSVADQMDQTSSHLLDRIPKTRTPSPVSMRDLHSPSPTPDTVNLLMSDVLETNTESGTLRSDNPFADVEEDDVPVYHPPEIQQKIPPRPIPPRPSPPESNKIVEQPQRPDSVADLFDFETNTAPKPPAPKSNQDIMSLFAAPKSVEPPKPDFLTSDILLMDNVAPIQSNLPQVIPNVAPIAAPIVSAPIATPIVSAPIVSAPIVSAPVVLTAPAIAPIAPVVAPALPTAPVVTAVPPARPAPPQRPAIPPQRPAPPPVPKLPAVLAEKISPPAAVEPIVEAKVQPKTVSNVPSIEDIAQSESEQPTMENAPISSIKINDEPYNGVHDVDKSDTISDNSSAVDSSIRTPGIATPFYSPGPDAQYLDRGQTPVDHQLNSTKQDMINTYINETSSYDASAASNPFGSPENAVTPQIVQTAPSIFQQSDDFDVFAAKFDSVKKDDVLLDSFGGSSGYKSPAPSDGKLLFMKYSSNVDQ